MMKIFWKLAAARARTGKAAQVQNKSELHMLLIDIWALVCAKFVGPNFFISLNFDSIENLSRFFVRTINVNVFTNFFLKSCTK